MKFKKFLLPIAAIALVACDKDSDNNNEAKQQAVLNNYAQMVSTNYSDALVDAQSLKTALQNFVNTPNLATQDAAKTAWLAARESYGVSEAYRFAAGPIDDADGPEGNLNAWPLDESYIDYVAGAPNSGIINNPTDFPTIDKATLNGANENGGETNISVGYHAIEFLLWGQDLTAPSAKQAGLRSFTDYVEDESETVNRRKQYLMVCADILIDDLTDLNSEWQSGGNYRSTFLDGNAEAMLSNILTGPGTLAKSELAAERIFVAYENRDQEDEHSCFADNTDRDIRLNLEGILNVLNGEYTSPNGSKVSGTSFLDLLRDEDAAAATNLEALMATAKTEVEKTATPFDFAIDDESTRPQVLLAVTALQNLGDGIAESAAKIGLTINTALPE